ncbi:hypothetical protein BpHYR1_010105 [Brachionus plicatilis]|uniref:Uncharacterized protein n=1 Tax=Brachionus plicatilis TaxID=10195 RepID=A0A3M7S7L7_BRAPC|nr:hypothetical protein BpHYR1_010105 [Brachionus plicatilis]
MFVCKSHDSFEYDHIGSVHSFGCGLSGMCVKIINGYVHLFAALELFQSLDQQIEVIRVRMIKVILAFVGLFYFSFGELFVERVHAKQRDPLDIQIFDYSFGHCSLARRASSTQADHKSFFHLTGRVVPWWPSCCVNCLGAFYIVIRFNDKINMLILTKKNSAFLSSEGQNHVLGGTKDVSVATIYRACFSRSKLKF